MEKKFVFLEHTADIKFKAFGSTMNNLFENCALAFSSCISGDKKIASKKKKIVEVSGDDLEALLYNFMDELIYLLDAENLAVSSAKVKILKNKLKAEIIGDNTKKYSLNHVKAATYAEMYIKKITSGKKEKYEAQVVLDV